MIVSEPSSRMPPSTFSFEAVDDCGHGDDRGDPDDNPQNGEPRTKRVLPQSIKGQKHFFPEFERAFLAHAGAERQGCGLRQYFFKRGHCPYFLTPTAALRRDQA